MTQFFQIVITGLTIGAIYALAALGFSIVYNATKVTNFANGEFVMMGGLISASLITVSHMPPLLAVLVACVSVTILGVLMDWLGLQHARRKTVLSYAMITLGIGISYRGLMQNIFGRDILFPPAFSGIPLFRAQGVFISGQNSLILVVLAVVSIALSYLFLRTRLGKAMRAASQQPRAAQLCGINPRHMAMIAFGMAGFLGAVAGGLVAPIGAAFYEYGLFFGLKGFAAAVLGGFGSAPGAVLGGLLIGLAESLTAGYINSAYKDAVALLILLVLLLVKPSGLLGRAEARRV
jgi:branched-chain amino acid transport system permease protein